jgi:hypothetical protein
MRRMITCLMALTAVGAAAATHAQPFQPSFTAGIQDAAGHFLGGTEMRVLAAHDGKLFAANGYWEDRPGPEGRQPPQILVLDAPTARWRLDHVFIDRQPNGRLRDLAVGALAEVRFATQSLLLASTWDLTGAARVFTRDDTSGEWTAVTLAEDRPSKDFLPQIRCFGSHRDRVTGIDLVFAGEMPRGIIAGAYDPASPGKIRWSPRPELDASAVSTNFSGIAGMLRVSSFAEANGRLYAAIGQQVFERIDGQTPTWHLIYTNPRPGHSETGLRGLTAVGPGALLAAVEGNVPRIVRIDASTGAETTELDLNDFLARAWGMRVRYMIAAYNDMTLVHTSRGDALLIGLMAFIPRNIPVGAGHTVVDVGYGLVESGAWYLVRWPDGRYDLHQVTADFGHPLVATRSILASPFNGDSNALYFAGFDANKAPAHNTAWIARTTLADALRP